MAQFDFHGSSGEHLTSLPKYHQRRIEREFLRLRRLSERTDLIDFHRIQEDHYLIHFRCRGMILDPRAGLELSSHHVVGIQIPEGRNEPFGPDHVTFVRPGNIFHPNIVPPTISLGSYLVSKTIDEVCQKVFEILTLRKCVLEGPACLNAEAAEWVRKHPDSVPTDTRHFVPERVRRY